MKAKTIWIIVGVIALILIVANWNKIFGQKKSSSTPSSFRYAGPVKGRKTVECNCTCVDKTTCKGTMEPGGCFCNCCGPGNNPS